ncbi:hypothetical protein [Niabella aquatica]
MKNRKRIIAIHPNTLGFGFVILSEKGEIIDYGITTVRPVSNSTCVKRINEMIKYYTPEILLVEDYESSSKSPRIKKLISELSHNIYAEVKVIKYSREQVKGIFEIFGARNKYEISLKIAEVYPELKSKLSHKRKPWEPENYYAGLFDAMALVITYQYLND